MVRDRGGGAVAARCRSTESPGASLPQYEFEFLKEAIVENGYPLKQQCKQKKGTNYVNEHTLPGWTCRNRVASQTHTAAHVSKHRVQN